MKTFFTADTHFEAVKLYSEMGRRVRPFSVDEWNEMFLHKINSMVERSDRLFILGDFAWKRPGYWRQRIRCRHVILILGNHDSEAKCRRVFGGNLHHVREVKNVCGQKVFLSHYPHAFWPSSHHGSLHLYGHCHHQREEYLDAIWPARRSMDVSPDTAYQLTGEWRPFSDIEVTDRLLARDGHDHLPFYEQYQAALFERFGEARNETC